MITQITMYQTTDETQFSNRRLAEAYEDTQEMLKYVDEHPIHTDWEPTADGSNLKDWLKDNPRIHIILLPEEE